MTGEILKQKIKETRYSQREIADFLGVAPQSLTSIFRSDDVRSGTLEKIASAIGVSMSFFYPCETTEINNVYARGRNVNTGDGNFNEGGNTELAAKLLEEMSELRKTNQQLMEANQKLMEKIIG